MELEQVQSKLEKNPSSEPALSTGATLTATVSGVLLLIDTVFPDLISKTVMGYITLALACGLPIITSLLIRGRVWAPKSVLEVLNQATEKGLAEAKRQADKKRSF